MRQSRLSSFTVCAILICLQDVTRWANQYLGVGGYSDHLITDLASDMADGITLLRLVQAICKHRTCPLHMHGMATATTHPFSNYYHCIIYFLITLI